MPSSVADSPARQTLDSRNQTCCFCGKGTTIRFSGCSDRILQAPGSFGFWGCSSCGSLHIAPIPSAATLRLAYDGNYMTHVATEPPEQERSHKTLLRSAVLANSYGYHHLSSGIPGKWQTIGKLASRFRVVRLRVGAYVQFLEYRPCGRLLDVGCGSGQFLRIASKLGWTARGLEPDGIAAALARNRGCDVDEGTIEAFDPGEYLYDAITMAHVLEHVADPRAVLTKLMAAVSENGVLVSITPNPASIVARAFGTSWYGLDPPRHFHIPTVKGLAKACEQLGFEAVHFTLPRISSCYAGESMSIRASGRAHQDRGKIIPFLFGLASQVCAALGLNLGEEIVCVIRKPRTSSM